MSTSVSISVSIYIYMYVYTYTYLYIYIDIGRLFTADPGIDTSGSSPALEMVFVHDSLPSTTRTINFCRFAVFSSWEFPKIRDLNLDHK